MGDLDRRFLLGGLAGAAGLSAFSAMAKGGPLNPPAGAVAPTAGPEPRTPVGPATTPGDATNLYRISQPGSYYLTGNVVGVAGKNGIAIAAGGVTLDLNGFDVLGFGGTDSFQGIRLTNPPFKAITLRNGSVRNWSGDGVQLAVSGCDGMLIENITASQNGIGIRAGGDTAVTRCSATANIGTGIIAVAGCQVSHCVANDNGTTGISLNSSCLASDCLARGNEGSGFTVSGDAAVFRCMANFNTGSGFSVGVGCTVAECTANNNSSRGITANFNTAIRSCNCNGNTGEGISVQSACIVDSCIAADNGDAGIAVTSRSSVMRNTCEGNGASTSVTGTGIKATGDHNRIDGNHCAQNDIGIDVDGSSNIIARNTCADNTLAYTIAANNLYGPIIDRRIPATVASTPAVNGFSASGTLASTDPNANFTV